jgi:integrase
MPAKQQGSVGKRGTSYFVRFYDEDGRERRQSGFATKSEANEWRRSKVDEIERIRRGDPTTLARREIPTLSQLLDDYLAQHVAEPSTIRTIRVRCEYATRQFGDVRIDRLSIAELRSWRATLPAGSAWGIVKALRQVLAYAVDVGLIEKNPAKSIPNPTPKRKEILTFANLAEVERVANEMLPRYRALPIFAALTGLRPQELFALERRDVDRSTGLLHVRQVLVDGELRPYGKTRDSIRVVPLVDEALAALDVHPVRMDTRLLFTTGQGNPINLLNWRNRVWKPALLTAGLEHRGPYALRHTFAAWAIAAGLPTFEIAKTMGTSLAMIERTYGHLLPDSADRARRALSAYLLASRDRASATQ